jgi:U3 small nucleolar RNA-associated protein 25
MSSFSIPKNTEDPLASTSATTEYPLDHLVNFRGNSDDNFRIGIKITRKAWRVVMMPANEDKLMECDIIIASPLGIKMQSEREESTDLLSSIEVAVVDGIDVMQMQNWDHVQVSSLVHTFSPMLMTVHILPPQQNAQITSWM